MARNTERNNTTEKTFNAVAKQYIKYNKQYLEVEDKFKVRQSDVKELSKYAEIQIPQDDKTLDNQKTNSDIEEGAEAGE